MFHFISNETTSPNLLNEIGLKQIKRWSKSEMSLIVWLDLSVLID